MWPGLGAAEKEQGCKSQPQEQGNALPLCKCGGWLLSLCTHVRSDSISECKALQLLSAVMESNEEVALLMGALHGHAVGRKLHPSQYLLHCTDLELGTGCLGEMGQDGEDSREAKQGASSRSPFSSPAAAAHPIFHKSGYTNLPASKICFRNKVGDC